MSENSSYLENEPARADIDALAGALVVEFGAPWCGHCLAAQSLIADAFVHYPHIRHIKVEDGPGRPLGRSFRIKLWPTLVFLRDGVELSRLTRPTDGAAIADVLAQIAG